MLATGQETSAKIARLSPAADGSTRTVYFEVDLPDPQRIYPVGTTASLSIDVGTPQPATVLPSVAAAIRGDKAIIFVVEGDRAKKVVVPVKGEEAGTLYLDRSLAPGAQVVTEGRSLLTDGDHVIAKLEVAAAPSPRASTSGGEKP